MAEPRDFLLTQSEYDFLVKIRDGVCKGDDLPWTLSTLPTDLHDLAVRLARQDLLTMTREGSYLKLTAIAEHCVERYAEELDRQRKVEAEARRAVRRSWWQIAVSLLGGFVSGYLIALLTHPGA